MDSVDDIFAAAVEGVTAIPTTTTATSLLATTTHVLSTASTVITAISTPGQGTEKGECQLLGPFAILIQGALGALALLSLVFKRWRERPQRALKVWGFDVSKQVVGSILLHLANLLMSLLSSGQLSIKAAKSSRFHANPCSFYLLNLAIDTTLGIPVLIVLLRILTYGALLTPLGSPPDSIRSGNYGQPPKALWWLKQSLIYFVGLLGMKLCVFFIFQLCPWMVHVGDWALRWTEGNEMIQVFFVMLFFPVIMNALQYYIIDGFIKNQWPTEHELAQSEDGDEDEDTVSRHRQRSAWDASFGSDDETEVVKKPARINIKAPKSKINQLDTRVMDEYDPDMDGVDSPTVVGSGSGSGSTSLKKGEEESLLGKSGPGTS